MLPYPGQKNGKAIYTVIVKIIKAISPRRILTLQEVGIAMINAVSKGYSKKILEITDIKAVAKA